MEPQNDWRPLAGCVHMRVIFPETKHVDKDHEATTHTVLSLR